MKNLHYEFTGETTVNRVGVTLHRIRATRDLPHFGVKTGDVGGWIEHTGNLKGNAWVGDEAQVSGGAEVSGNAKVFGEARVSSSANVFGNAEVYGNAQVYRDALVYGNAKVYGNAQVYDNAQVYGNAQVFGYVCVFSYAQVFGNAKVYGEAQVYGGAWVYDSAKVSGYAKVSGDARVYKDARIESSADYFQAVTYTSGRLLLTLTRQKAGKHLITMGCWEGSIDELDTLINGYRWIDTFGDEADKARPEMLALCQMLRARIERWEA